MSPPFVSSDTTDQPSSVVCPNSKETSMMKHTTQKAKSFAAMNTQKMATTPTIETPL